MTCTQTYTHTDVTHWTHCTHPLPPHHCTDWPVSRERDLPVEQDQGRANRVRNERQARQAPHRGEEARAGLVRSGGRGRQPRHPRQPFLACHAPDVRTVRILNTRGSVHACTNACVLAAHRGPFSSSCSTVMGCSEICRRVLLPPEGGGTGLQLMGHGGAAADACMRAAGYTLGAVSLVAADSPFRQRSFDLRNVNADGP